MGSRVTFQIPHFLILSISLDPLNPCPLGPYYVSLKNEPQCHYEESADGNIQ